MPESFDPTNQEGTEEFKRTPEQDELYDAQSAVDDAREATDLIREEGVIGENAGGKHTPEDWQKARADEEAAQQRLEAARKAVVDAGQSTEV